MSAISGVVLSIVIIAVLAEAGDKENKAKGLMIGLEQKPIFYAGEFRNTDRELGASCQFSFDCSSGCCLKTKAGGRHCTMKAKKDEPCSGGQVKLDSYMHHCPCEKGNRYCTSGDPPKCSA